jgi:hypothetical protein
MTTFPERLNDTLGRPTYYAREDFPLRYFAEHGFSNKKRKILIYETAERYLFNRFTKLHNSDYKPDNRSFIRRSVTGIRDNVFLENTEKLYQNLMARNYLTTNLYSQLKTFKFNTFKYITELTPVYSLDYDVPWLFYYDQLNDEPSSFYYNHSDDEIDNFCNNIADLAVKLDEDYNLEMVFMVIPSKFTIYHKLVNQDEYNNFIPRINEGLKERGVPVISVYEDFKSSDEVLYYGTDTHWNQKGLSIALSKTIGTLDSLNIKNDTYESSTLSWGIWDQDK